MVKKLKERIALMQFSALIVLGIAGGISLISNGGLLRIIAGIVLILLDAYYAVGWILAALLTKNVNMPFEIAESGVTHYLEDACSLNECPYDEYSEEEEES